MKPYFVTNLLVQIARTEYGPTKKKRQLLLVASLKPYCDPLTNTSTSYEAVLHWNDVLGEVYGIWYIPLVGFSVAPALEHDFLDIFPCHPPKSELHFPVSYF
ncbi:unnamed protein product, partial [Laminaria digitata]